MRWSSGTIVMILAALAGDFRATFVEHAGQQRVTAEADARAAGGRCVRSVMLLMVFVVWNC